MEADPSARISPGRRYLILVAVVLGSSLYSTALLTTSTILPQMQGALSATQDEIAWVMTFNILATARGDADDGLAGCPLRRQECDGMGNCRVHGIDPAVRARGIARGAGGAGASCRAEPVRRWCRCRRPSCSTPSRAASRRWCSRSSACPSASRPSWGRCSAAISPRPTAGATRSTCWCRSARSRSSPCASRSRTTG